MWLWGIIQKQVSLPKSSAFDFKFFLQIWFDFKNLQESLFARVGGPRLQENFFLMRKSVKIASTLLCFFIFTNSNFNSNLIDPDWPVVDLQAGLLVVGQVVAADHHQHALPGNLDI